MKAKLAIVISEFGVEAITIMSSGTEERTAGRSLIQSIENEITEFETAIKRKLNSCNGLGDITKQ